MGRTIETNLKLTGEKEFNQQMKALNNGLKTTKSDMAALSSEFDNNANSIQSLSAKQKLLQSSVAQHQSKVDALTQQYKAAAAAYGENSAMAQKYKQDLNNATVALNKQKSALEETNAQLKTARNPIKSAIEGYKNLVERLAEAQEKTEQFAEKQEKANTLLSRAAKPITGLVSATGKGVGAVAKGVGAVSAAAAAGVAAIGAGGLVALKAMASMAREAAEAAKAAQEAGETLTASQEQWLAYSGQLDALDASVASAKSALAGVLLPMLGDLSSEGAAFLNDFTRDMEAAAGDTGKQTQVLSDYIVKGAKLIKTKLPEYIAMGKELLGGLGAGLSESGPELLDMGTDLVFDLLDGIIENAPALAEAGIALIQKLTESLIARGPDLLTSAVGMVTQIVTGLAQAAPDLIPAAAQLVTQLIVALVQSAPQLLLAGMELIYGIISGLINGIGDIVNSADEIIDSIVTAFSDNADEFLDVGKNIVTGIWGGITSATEWLYGLLTGWVSNIVDWIKDKLEIQSPSKRMKREVGLQMGRGVGEGWLESMKEVNQMISDSLDMSFDIPEFNFAPRKTGTRAYATAGGKVVNLYFYAKTITESEINMVVDIVNRKLGEDL